ncbi:hypothetical protein L596_009989 [Steinernema carpocapsae]|uniref:Uncharacterized protein n=1 Tax=Steinernema carpocapsae TaxID=34508 RepID=A0A4U5PGY7_STECR|nr:hypothetical protein L596_009989 [Steinernema carpocapsae]
MSYYYLNVQATQQAEAENLLEICYGLRSPKEATRLRAVQAFALLLPQQIVAGNAFVEAVGTLEEIPEAGRLREAVLDSVDFLTLVVHSGNPFLTHQVEQMAQVAYFFNLLAKALQRGEEAVDSADELQRVIREHRQKVEELEEVKKTSQEPSPEALEAMETQKAEILRLRQEIQASQELMEVAISCDSDVAKMEAANKALTKELLQASAAWKETERGLLDRIEDIQLEQENILTEAIFKAGEEKDELLAELQETREIMENHEARHKQEIQELHCDRDATALEHEAAIFKMQSILDSQAEEALERQESLERKLMNSVETNQQVREALEEKEEELAELQERFSAVDEQRQQLEVQKNDIESLYGRTVQENCSLKAQQEEAEQRCHDLNNTKKRLERILSAQSVQLEESEALQAENAKLKAELIALRRENAEQSEEIDGFKVKLAASRERMRQRFAAITERHKNRRN